MTLWPLVLLEFTYVYFKVVFKPKTILFLCENDGHHEVPTNLLIAIFREIIVKNKS